VRASLPPATWEAAGNQVRTLPVEYAVADALEAADEF
jgi:hypothetical protein